MFSVQAIRQSESFSALTSVVGKVTVDGMLEIREGDLITWLRLDMTRLAAGNIEKYCEMWGVGLESMRSVLYKKRKASDELIQKIGGKPERIFIFPLDRVPPSSPKPALVKRKLKPRQPRKGRPKT